MKRLTTILLLLGLITANVLWAQDAQQVTVREINDIPDENIATLEAAGENLQASDIPDLIFNDLEDQRVQFTAVFLSDPYNSGLANLTDGQPNRIHAFVRDTAAVSQGVEGMGIQLVDGAPAATGILNFGIGDVVTITGEVDPFGTSMQIVPESFEFVGTLEDLGLPETLLDPVLVTSDQVNKAVGADGVQTNWENLEDLSGQYVRIENARIAARSLSDPDRPDFYVSSDGGTTVVNFYDTSGRFRNDKGDYPQEFNVRRSEDGDFVPPPPGAVVNIQGFLTLQGNADAIGRSVPASAFLSISPMEDRGCGDSASNLSCDFEVTESPPQVSDVTRPETVIGANEAATITATVAADPTRAIDTVVLTYTTSEDETEMEVVMTDNGDGTFSGDIPGQEDGVFVIYSVTAADNTGAETQSSERNYRVLGDGINEIMDVQLTYNEGQGDSPFTGITAEMDLTATVQSDPSTSGLIVLQDDPDLGPWSGVILDGTSEQLADLQQGDVINITEATVEENFGLTRLTDITYTTVTEGGDPLSYKEVTTDILVDRSIAEAHEGMMLTFDDVVILNLNPDAPSGPFGEFTISSDGTTANAIRVDDESDAVSFEGNDPASVYSVGERLDFIRGVFSYTFSNFKLMPESETDIGAVINLATEDEQVPGSFALRQNYPNPFNPATTIEYTVGHTGAVTLEVFDVMGRHVATLVDGELPVGTYTATFDAGRLASGLYVYRLTAGSKMLVKTMMLLK